MASPWAWFSFASKAAANVRPKELVPSDAGTVDAGISLTQQQAAARVRELLRRNAEEADATVDRYCEKTKALKARALFEDQPDAGTNDGPGEDAALFLAPRVDWYTGQSDSTRAPQRTGLLHLPAELSARIRASGDNWPNVLSVSDAAAFDFGWMRQTLAYSHWNIGAAGPIAEQGRQVDLGLVVPDYRFFFQWSKLRYIQAFAQGDFDEAQIEVQHLAVLVGSSGGMVAQNAAVFMVKVEGQAAQAAAQRGIPITALNRVSAVDLDELQQLGEAGLSYFWPGVSADVMKRALPCLPLPCAGFVEGAFMRNYVGPLAAA